MKPAAPASLALALVFASAFGHGGETLWAQGSIAIAGAIGLGSMAIYGKGKWSVLLRLAGMCWAALVAWCIVQALPLGLAEHPSWAVARQILPSIGHGSIAADPQATLDVAIRLTAYAGLFALGLTNSAQSRNWMLVLSLGIAAVAMVGLCIDPNSVGPAGLAKIRHAGDTSYPFANRNHYGVFAGIGVVLAAAALVDREARLGWRRFVLAAVLITGVTGVFACHSRAGMAAVLMGGIVCCGYLRFSHQRLALAFAFSLAVAALFAAGAVARFATFETALELRGEIMEVSWLLAWQRPWVGVGSLDLTLQAVAPASWPALVQSAHNVVVESFVERGAPATIVAVVALVLVMGQCARSIRSSAAGRVVNAAAFGVATIVLLHGMVDFSVQSPTIAALVAIVLGLGAGCAKAPASVSPIGLARGNPYAGARA